MTMAACGECKATISTSASKADYSAACAGKSGQNIIYIMRALTP